MLAGLLLASCGGGQDVSKTVKNVPSSAATGGTVAPTAAPTKKAADLLPKLSDLGYETSNIQQLPTGGTGQEHIAELYRKLTPPALYARVEIYSLPQLDLAQTTFKNEVAALTNPPPGSDLPGPNSANQGIMTADEAQSFVTTNPDSTGTLVWTDVYRFGNVVFMVFVQGPQSADAASLRKALADRIAAEMK